MNFNIILSHLSKKNYSFIKIYLNLQFDNFFYNWGAREDSKPISGHHKDLISRKSDVTFMTPIMSKNAFSMSIHEDIDATTAKLTWDPFYIIDH
jgi:hypothetical protein